MHIAQNERGHYGYSEIERRREQHMKLYKRMIPILLVVILGITLLMGACTKEVAPEEVIKLTYATNMSLPQAFAVASQAWIDKIEKESGGLVDIEPYWGGALVDPRQAYSELLAGVADIVAWTASFEREGFDLEKVLAYAYYGVKDYDTSRRIYAEVGAKYPEIDQEFAATKTLCLHSVAPYHVQTVDRPIRKLEDFGGLTFKANGVHINILNELGAEGIAVPMTEVYVAMQKGTMDGALSPYDTLETMKFADLVKYCTYLNIATGPAPHRSMNLDKWNSLPPKVQKVFEDNIEWYGKKFDEETYNGDISAKKFGIEQGVEMLTLPPEELSKLYEIIGSVVSEEAAKLQDKGFSNATAIYKEIRRLIEKYS